jgi:hypothetical protein
MKIRKVALIIFYDDKKRILLQDRRGISRLGEEWGYFGGGFRGHRNFVNRKNVEKAFKSYMRLQ